MQFRIELEGARELQKKLDRLEKTAGKKIVRSATRKGSTVIRKATQSNAKSMVGGEMGTLIGKNVVTRAHKKQKKGSYALWTGTRPGVDEFVHIAKGKSKYKDKRTYIPAAIEYGHDNAAAIPFARSAVDSKGEQAKQTTIKEIDRGIKQEARRGS